MAMARRNNLTVMRNWKCLKGFSLLLSFGFIVGCHGSYWDQDSSALPYPAVWGRPNSIVFQSPTVRGLAGNSIKTSQTFPWYVSRNDVVPTAFAGYRSATTERIVNYTNDRQVTTGGHVRDHYYNTTRRRTVTQVVR